nr:YbaK/EbsC family protein [Ornithinimicrobium cryptoxanthini]
MTWQTRRRWWTRPTSPSRSRRTASWCSAAGGEIERVTAALVLATTRADVNTTIRKSLDVRKASFMQMERAVTETAMEFGGITPVGLPADWPVLVDSRVVEAARVVIGSGIRGSKLRLPGASVARLPGVRVVKGLAR